MTARIFKYTLILLTLNACSFLESETIEIPEKPDLNPDIMYHKEPGLMRFVQELNLPVKDTTFLVIANNKTCNCGSAGIREVDSMVKRHGDYPRIWVMEDNVPTFRVARKPGDIIIDGRNYDMKSYGFSSIYPQLFTFYKGKLIKYDKLMYKR